MTFISKSTYDMIEQLVYTLVRKAEGVYFDDLLYLFTHPDSENLLTDEETLMNIVNDMHNKNLIRYQRDNEGVIIFINEWNNNIIEEFQNSLKNLYDCEESCMIDDDGED